MTNPFKQFNRTILKPLGILWEKVHKLDNMRGDDFISIKRSGFGTTIGLNLNKARERIAKKSASDLGDTIRAICTADAGPGLTIAATLYKLDGTTGEAVTVHCSIANGSDLDEAEPRLEIGLDIPVYRSIFDNAGTPESRWCYNGTFQATEDCTCEQADAVFNSVTIAEDEKLTFDGVGGNTYDIYNSATSEMERWVDGVKITTWKA